MTVINSYDKPASEIRPGNYVFGQRVLENDRKRVNCLIRLADAVDGRTAWTFKLTDMLEVGVEELTDEEKAQEAEERQREKEKYFVKAVRDYVKSSKLALSDAGKFRKERVSKGWGQLDYQTIQAELTAYAAFDLAREIEGAFSSFDDKTDTTFATELEVAINLVERFKSRLTSQAMQSTRALSRSTNVISNLCEDLELSALASFLHSLSYSAYGVVELPSRW